MWIQGPFPLLLAPTLLSLLWATLKCKPRHVLTESDFPRSTVATHGSRGDPCVTRPNCPAPNASCVSVYVFGTSGQLNRDHFRQMVPTSV